MQTISLPCVDPLHASRSAELDWTEYTASILMLPDGATLTAQQLTAGGLCSCCARLQPPPPEEP